MSAPTRQELPQDLDAEGFLISCCMLPESGAETIAAAREAGITPDCFYDSKLGTAFSCACSLLDGGEAAGVAEIARELRSAKQLDAIGGYPFLTQISGLVPTSAQARKWIERVREQALLREIIRSASGVVEDCYSFTGGIDEFAEAIRERIHGVTAQAGRAVKLRDRLQARRFNLATPPPEPVPRFFINGRGVSTAGNLTNLIAQAKAGKTALIAANIAAAIVAEFNTLERDTLGVTASAPGGMKLLHIDTEQSPHDHDQLVRRSLRRAGVENAPEWLWSYGLAGFCAAELRQSLSLLISQASAAGGIFAVIIDGPADMVVDVNDPEESNAFVAELHNLAIVHNCPILNVVHENPGQDSGKMRGHFGSQLERKAESNLRLKKSDEITVVFSEKMRRAPILEKEGPRFRWDDGAGMHVTCSTAAVTSDDAKRERLHDQADAVFVALGKSALTWSELRNGIGRSEGIGQSGASKRFDAMKALGVVKKDLVGLWRIAA